MDLIHTQMQTGKIIVFATIFKLIKRSLRQNILTSLTALVKILRDYCYPHKYWINHNIDTHGTHITTMLKAVKAK